MYEFCIKIHLKENSYWKDLGVMGLILLCIIFVKRCDYIIIISSLFTFILWSLGIVIIDNMDN